MTSDQLMRALAVVLVIAGTLFAIGEAAAHGFGRPVEGVGSGSNARLGDPHAFGWRDPDFAYGVNSRACVLRRLVDRKGEIAVALVCA